MKNDINIIKNELIEQTNEKKIKELERKKEKEFKEFKELCRCLIYKSIYDSLNNGATLKNLYLKRNYIINATLQDIKSQYIEVEDMNSWDNKLVKVRQYDYPDYLIIDILSSIFDKEYSKEERRIKKEKLYLKEDLEKRLYDYVKETIEEVRKSTSMYVIITNLSLQETKESIINDLSLTDEEKSIIDTIYTKVINRIKKEYTTEYAIAKKEYNKVEIPLWTKIIAFNKGTSILGKLFK